ncbi:MAG: DUF4347 domain-containing protein, partial [Desulfobacteraceae bacterium]
MKQKPQSEAICFESLEPRLLFSGTWGIGADAPVSETRPGLDDGSNPAIVVTVTDAETSQTGTADGAVDLLGRTPALNIVESADAGANLIAAPTGSSEPSDTADSMDAASATDSLSEEADHHSVHELAIVNDNVADYEQLVADLQAGDDHRIIDVAVIDGDGNGIRQVSELLAQYSDLSAVHFIAHGADGRINIGGTWLNDTSLPQYQDAVSDWGKALNENGDMLFYGCNIASGSAGQSLLNHIAGLTGTDVAASDDPTGSTQLGGDWDLEFDSGTIETQVAVDSSAQAGWDHLLAVPTVTVPAGFANTTTNEETALVFSTGNGNAISISGNPSDLAEVMLDFPSGATGVITLSGTTGLTFTLGDGTDDTSMRFTGTVADINAALDGLSYQPDTDYNGDCQLQVTAWDRVLSNTDPNLLAHYEFEDTGDLSNDTSPGGGYDGTVSGAVGLVDSQQGKVLDLDNAGDYIEIAGHYGNPADITLSARVNLTTADTNGSVVISLGDSVGIVLDDVGRLNGFYYNGSNWPQTFYTATLAGTGWHHVAFTFDEAGQQATLYLDGVQVGSTATLGDSISYTLGANSIIGKHGNGSTNWDFTGSIDDVCIYNRVLDSTEIACLAGSDAEVVDIRVLNVDDPAMISGDISYTGNEGDAVGGDMDATDADGLTDSTYFTVTAQGAYGTAAIDAATGVWTFTPANPDWFGSDTFTVTVTDDQGGTTTQVISVTLANVDDPAVISGDISYNGNEGDAVGGDMDATDTDGLTDSTYFTVTAQGAYGTAAIDAATGVWTFTPANPDWFGS